MQIVLRDDDPRCGTLALEGWSVVERSWAAHLDVRDLDVEALTRYVARVQSSWSVRELGVMDVPAALALDLLTRDDYPGGAATRHTPLDSVTALPNPKRRAFGVFDSHDLLIAMTYADIDGNEAEVDFTVVRADLRRLGLGLAVKAASILALARAGVERMRTGGADGNAAILTANDRVGFILDEHWLTFELIEHVPESM